MEQSGLGHTEAAEPLATPHMKFDGIGRTQILPQIWSNNNF